MIDDLKIDGHVDAIAVDDEPTTGVVGDQEESNILCAVAPVGLLAELTHRCPLQCPYCSNPVELESGGWLASAYGKPALDVNSVHYQGIGRLAETSTSSVGLMALAVPSPITLSLMSSSESADR